MILTLFSRTDIMYSTLALHYVDKDDPELIFLQLSTCWNYRNYRWLIYPLQRKDKTPGLGHQT